MRIPKVQDIEDHNGMSMPSDQPQAHRGEPIGC